MGVIRWRCLRLVMALTAGVVVLSSGPAMANDMDPVLARMWRYDHTTNQIVARNDLFDGLALDLAQAIAPNVNYPAETLGWSGFFMGLEATLTFIDSEDMHWRCGIEGSGGGHGGNEACNSWEPADGALFVPAVHVRKGLPYSLELGFQVQYIANSEMVAIGGEIRWAPFEGYRTGWMGYLPDISVAFVGSYLMGSNELVLGTLGGSVAISYPFTISGQFTITPYVNYQFFIVGSDHEQVYNSHYIEDPQGFQNECQAHFGTEASCSPYVDFHDGRSRNFGQDMATLKFHRLNIGGRILWENLSFTPQFGVTLPWFTGTAEGRAHFQMSVSVGTDF